MIQWDASNKRGGREPRRRKSRLHGLEELKGNIGKSEGRQDIDQLSKGIKGHQLEQQPSVPTELMELQTQSNTDKTHGREPFADHERERVDRLTVISGNHGVE